MIREIEETDDIANDIATDKLNVSVQLSDAEIAFNLINLFTIDLLGRHSSASAIFRKKTQSEYYYLFIRMIS